VSKGLSQAQPAKIERRRQSLRRTYYSILYTASGELGIKLTHPQPLSPLTRKEGRKNPLSAFKEERRNGFAEFASLG